MSVVLTTSGNPLTPEPAAEQGYRIERAYYTLDGKPIEPTAIKQNDRFVVALTVTEYEAAFARLLLVDRLPSGLEIDNPDLFEGGSTEALAFLKKTVEPAHTEYRDDRFVAAFARDGHDKANFTVAYIVRAVTPGHYVSPPATIEDMYRPETIWPHRLWRYRCCPAQIKCFTRNILVRSQRSFLHSRWPASQFPRPCFISGLRRIRSILPPQAKARASSSIATGAFCGPSRRRTDAGGFRFARAMSIRASSRCSIAYEDRRFYSHHGVDFLSLGRAALQWISHGHIVSGGSTLTMQVARLDRAPSRKIRGGKIRANPARGKNRTADG